MASGRELERFPKLETTMLATALILAGAAMFAVWFFLRKKAQATSRWPSTPGRVIASDVYVHNCGENGTVDEVRVTYDYAVAGVTLRGNRISIGGQGSGSTKARLARYHPGAVVNVFYDPHKPASAVLESKLPGKFIMFPIMGVFLVILGAWLAVQPPA